MSSKYIILRWIHIPTNSLYVSIPDLFGDCLDLFLLGGEGVSERRRGAGLRLVTGDRVLDLAIFVFNLFSRFLGIGKIFWTFNFNLLKCCCVSYSAEWISLAVLKISVFISSFMICSVLFACPRYLFHATDEKTNKCSKKLNRF